MIKSKALEVNLADYHVETTIRPKYAVLQDVMSKYYGLMDGLSTFLKEISHPYKNWLFIINEARTYSLDYFHLLKKHPKGDVAADLYLDMFLDAVASAKTPAVKGEAADNMLLFIRKIAKDSGDEMDKFMPVLNRYFDRIRDLPDSEFEFFLNSFYQLDKIVGNMFHAAVENSNGFRSANLLLYKYYDTTYARWMDVEDPYEWFTKEAGEGSDVGEVKEIFTEMSREYITGAVDRLKRIMDPREEDLRETSFRLAEQPGNGHFIERYQQAPVKLFRAAKDDYQGNRWKLFFLFHVMSISGLSGIHEEALRNINRTLTWLISNEEIDTIKKLMKQTFFILKTRVMDFPETSLNCVLNMGEGVYKTDDNEFVNFFIDFVIDLGFQSPMITGVGDDWQVRANACHIQNIRIWMKLIEKKPQWSTRLLSALIIHLSVGGVFIKDTDLFPRDITEMLNSDIEPVYNLTKQLVRLFPTFFNDIGAEGELRDISTRIDEICNRKDVLVHFLRKQGHVESSNRIIGFIEAVLEFWMTGDRDVLLPYVPPYLYKKIEASGPYIDGIRTIMTHLRERGIEHPRDFLCITADGLKDHLDDIPDAPERDIERVELARSFYKLLNQKYNLGFVEIDQYISQLSTEALPDLNLIRNAVSEPSLKKKIKSLLDYLEVLKNLILSADEFEIREDIYQKRHITVDIPSMYGSYHELKFDAMGLTLRIEALLNVYFEELVESIDLTLITKATFFQIHDRLKLFEQALMVDGLASDEFTRQMDFLAHALETRGFSYTQYLDIFKGFAQAVKNIINDNFNNIHEQNLNRVLSRIPEDGIIPKYKSGRDDFDGERSKHRISEIFFRDKLSLSLGLTKLDLLLSRILNILFKQAERLSAEDLHQLLNYDPQRAMAAIGHEDSKEYGIIHLGNKGLNLLKLVDYGFPVPPGFIITTEVFRCQKIIASYRPARRNFQKQVSKQIESLEDATGLSFGSREKPLLLSVRSGSSISQPGMMDTLLNVGISEAITEGIADYTNNAWFAWDNYRRFLQSYGMVFGLVRNGFDAVIDDFKKELNIPYKRGFSGEQMKRVALAYKEKVLSAGVEIYEDPFEQLLVCIKNVFASWDSPRAKEYRKIMGISDDWGTAVTVQAMVYGNMSDASGTGVLFTHSPRLSGDALRLWGDFTIENQGEDVVSGLVKTLPISKIQQDIEQRETDTTLETDFPEIYNTLKEYVFQLIYDRGWGPQEMEFTFEGPSRKHLYILQTREMAMRERKKNLIFDLKEVLSKASFIGHGIGVSGGAMCGRIVFTLEEIEKWRKKEKDTHLIVIRGDTVPDDIREIYAGDGLLTARGGLTSHAAVVAHRLEKTCVVGCSNLICNEEEKTADFDGEVLHSGDYISLDGQEGSVYKGRLKVRTEK